MFTFSIQNHLYRFTYHSARDISGDWLPSFAAAHESMMRAVAEALTNRNPWLGG